MHSVILTGGGTGGHIMPNLALIPELYKHFDQIVYLGGNGMEKDIVPQYGIKFYETKVVKLDRTNIFENAKIPFILHGAIKEAIDILKSENAGVVFSKGGYASLPATLAAHKLGIPVIVHESDYTMGVANKLESKFAERTLTSFPETDGGEFVGNPIRSDIFYGNAETARKMLNLSANGKKTLLILGGSSGSEFINSLCKETIDELLKFCNVILVTGKNNCEIKITAENGKGNFKSLDFCKEIEDLYALADGFVIRGGANSLAEATALGKPTLCIPLPKGESRGDQIDNAKSYAKRGFVTLLEQRLATKETFIGCAKYLLNQKSRPLCPETANKKISDIIFEEYKKKFCPILRS